jgi:hypothetical protein
VKGTIMPENVVDQNLQKVVQLCYEMLEFADKGDKCRKDAGCGIVYGTLRDVAYKVRRLAEKELAAHNHKKKTENKSDGDSQSSTYQTTKRGKHE